MGPTWGPSGADRWAPCWPTENCYLGFYSYASDLFHCTYSYHHNRKQCNCPTNTFQCHKLFIYVETICLWNIDAQCTWFIHKANWQVTYRYTECNTVQCHHNAVNFLKNIHKKKTPHSSPVSSLFCGSSIWLIFCLTSCNHLCNILSYWIAS